MSIKNEFTPLIRWAKVIDNVDPDQLGKCKLRVMPEFNGISDNDLKYFPPHQNYCGGGTNSSHCVPEIGEMIKVKILDPFWQQIEYLNGDYVENLYPYANFSNIVSNIAELGGQTYPQPLFVQQFTDGSFIFRNTETGEMGFYHSSKSYFIFDANGNIIANSSTNDISLNGKDGLLQLKTSLASLYTLLKNMLTALKDMMTPGNIISSGPGSPAQWIGAVLTDLTTITTDLSTTLDQLMKV